MFQGFYFWNACINESRIFWQAQIDLQNLKVCSFPIVMLIYWEKILLFRTGAAQLALKQRCYIVEDITMMIFGQFHTYYLLTSPVRLDS